MKRAVLLGVLAFAAALVVVMPAGWAGSLLPSMVECARWHGTIWRGGCRGITINAPGTRPVTLENARWELHPAALLRGRMSADIALTDARGDATGLVQFTFGGMLMLRGVSARALFGPDLPTAMPAGWSGRVEATAVELDWQSNELHHLQGELRLTDLRDEQSRELGNYTLAFPPATEPPFTGQLVDNGGPFEASGKLELSMDRRWSLQASVRARPGADPRLAGFLGVLGGPDAAGRYPLSLEGSFK